MRYLPPELLELDQWVVANSQKEPINPATGKFARVNDRATWCSYQLAKEYAEKHSLHLGFVFTRDDPFVFIDLDNKSGDERLSNLHSEILRCAGNTYIERSISGRGYHVLLKGKMESGCRMPENGIEIYPHERYMLITGDSIQSYPISNGQELIDSLVERIDKKTATWKPAASLPEIDDEVLIANVRNQYGTRFEKLWSGEWQDLHPSQSEADLELCCQLAKYTSDNSQIRKLFLRSALGQRDKAHRKDYLLNYTIPKARKIAGDERHRVEHGKMVVQAILAGQKSQQRSLLVPFAEFINYKVSILQLVKGILGQGGLSVLYGAPGAGKSFLALDLCYALATGESWMGRGVSQGSVIYACGEGVAGFSQRVRGLAKVKGNNCPLMYILPHVLSVPDEIDKFDAILSEVNQKTGMLRKLLVLDTLSRYYGDGDDENSARDMKRFVKSVSSFMENFPDLHIMVIHHSGKDVDRGMRGSSVLLGAADTVIKCRKDGSRYAAVVEKQKDGQESVPLPFLLEEVELGEDEDGELITTCVVRPDLEVGSEPLTGIAAQAVDVLSKLKIKEERGREGNLVGIMTKISYVDYREAWKGINPNAKSDTVRKGARRALTILLKKGLVNWGGGEGSIMIKPEFDFVST